VARMRSGPRAVDDARGDRRGRRDCVRKKNIAKENHLHAQKEIQVVRACPVPPYVNPVVQPLLTPAFSFVILSKPTARSPSVSIVGVPQWHRMAPLITPIPTSRSARQNQPSGKDDSVMFEIGVNPGSPSPGPVGGADDEWNDPWDEEIARVIGGDPYPLGEGRCPWPGIDVQVSPANFVRGVIPRPRAAPTPAHKW